MKKIFFISARHPLTTTVKDGGVSLIKSNFECLSPLGEIQAESILPDKGSVFEKLLRILFSLFGFAGGLYPWKEKELLKILSENKFDVVFIDNSNYGRLARLIRQNFPTIQVIGHFHNIEKEYILESLRAPQFLKRILSRASAKNEKDLVRFSDTAICLSKRDSDGLRKHYGRKADYIVPLSLESAKSVTASNDNIHPRHLLYCGSLFAPNVEGLSWFIKEVLPDLDFHLDVVGFRMEEANLPKSDKVKNWGTVDDLEVHYNDAFAVINPIFSGAGMKAKTIEAMKFGKAVFGSTEAWVGIQPDPHLPLYNCQTKEDFKQAIGMHSQKFSQTAFPEVQSFFENHFSNNKKKDTFKGIILPAPEAKLHVGAVITSFNPPDNFYENVQGIALQAEQVVLVDNASSEKYRAVFDKILRNLKNVVMILNSKNLGIGEALNQGTKKLLENPDLNWIATFDHDTQIPASYFTKLVDSVRRDSLHQATQIIGPRFTLSGEATPFDRAVEPATAIITSGAMYSRSVFNKIGFFRSDFFIDSIDHEFCLRAIANGLRVAQVNTVTIQHRLGLPQKTSFLGVFSFYTLNYSGLRKYHMIRNFIFLVRLYGETQPRWLLKNSGFLIKEIVKTVFFEKNKGQNIKALLKGLKDGLATPISTKDFSK